MIMVRTLKDHQSKQIAKMTLLCSEVDYGEVQEELDEGHLCRDVISTVYTLKSINEKTVVPKNSD